MQKGNPLFITGITDLEHENLTIINPQRGTGTRLWLDQYLQKIGVETANIKGFEFENDISTYSAIASAIANGTADIGLGIYPVAINLAWILFLSMRIVMTWSCLKRPFNRQ